MNKGKKITVATSPGRQQRKYTNETENRSNCLYSTLKRTTNKGVIILTEQEIKKVIYELQQDHNLLAVLSDSLENVVPNPSIKRKSADESLAIAYEVKRDYDNWQTLITLAKSNLADLIDKLQA